MPLRPDRLVPVAAQPASPAAPWTAASTTAAARGPWTQTARSDSASDATCTSSEKMNWSSRWSVGVELGGRHVEQDHPRRLEHVHVGEHPACGDSHAE